MWSCLIGSTCANRVHYFPPTTTFSLSFSSTPHNHARQTDGGPEFDIVWRRPLSNLRNPPPTMVLSSLTAAILCSAVHGAARGLAVQHPDIRTPRSRAPPSTLLQPHRHREREGLYAIHRLDLLWAQHGGSGSSGTLWSGVKVCAGMVEC